MSRENIEKKRKISPEKLLQVAVLREKAGTVNRGPLFQVAQRPICLCKKLNRMAIFNSNIQ
jgi:hypothetical protein